MTPDQMTIVDVVAGVLVANGLTVAAIYFFMRIKRNERDHVGRLGLLGVCAVAGLFALALTA